VARRGLAGAEKKAAEEQAHLVLIDESGFFLNPLVRRTWAPVGRTPVLEGWGRHRDKVSAIAALTVSPVRHDLGLYFLTDPRRFLDGGRVADFLRWLLRHLRGRVIVVWDRGTNHKGAAVGAVLRRFPRLSVEWLPSYAPELNPVECVWSYLKHGQLANFVPESVRHLDDIVTDHLIDLRIEPPLLRSLWEGSQLPFPDRLSQPAGQ
jgi:putative transposase